MQNIKKILEENFHKTGWVITKPEDGWEKGSYIATRNDEKYFIKFGINSNVMIKLSQIRVTPRVFITGEKENEKYMIQEFSKDAYVPREWFENNLKNLSDFLKIYHNDKEHFQIVRQNITEDRLSLSGELNDFMNQLNKISQQNEFKKVRESINELKRRYEKLVPLPQVPVHDDPNTKNIFLTKNGLKMIDWNKIRISDCFSDTGAILWWYVPPQKWEEYLFYADMKITDEIIERIYLAAAKMTMGFILWSIEHKKDITTGLNDFTEAINKRANPRAWFTE